MSGNQDQWLCGDHCTAGSERQSGHRCKCDNDQGRWERRGNLGAACHRQREAEESHMSSRCGKGGAIEYVGKSNIANVLEGSLGLKGG